MTHEGRNGLPIERASERERQRERERDEGGGGRERGGNYRAVRVAREEGSLYLDLYSAILARPAWQGLLSGAPLAGLSSCSSTFYRLLCVMCACICAF
jgi:hypothetical protein